jgi:hypothetical protein
VAAVPTAEAVVSVAVTTLEGEDLGKKCNKRIKPHWKKRKGGEKARQTDDSKHPHRDVWLMRWGHLEP